MYALNNLEGQWLPTQLVPVFFRHTIWLGSSALPGFVIGKMSERENCCVLVKWHLLKIPHKCIFHWLTFPIDFPFHSYYASRSQGHCSWVSHGVQTLPFKNHLKLFNTVQQEEILEVQKEIVSTCVQQSEQPCDIFPKLKRSSSNEQQPCPVINREKNFVFLY